MQDTVATELKGVERASLLLISLGSRMASEVLQYLPPREVEILCAEISKRRTVDPEEERTVLHAYEKDKEDTSPTGGVDYARSILEQSLGVDRASQIMSDIADKTEARPFDWLKQTTTRKVATSLESERPQVIAMALAHLPIDKAADIISRLPSEVQGDIAYRLHSMQPVDRGTVKVVDDILRSKLVTETQGDVAMVGGMQSLVNILNNADRGTENMILQYLESIEPEIAESVKQQMFVFDDIVRLDNRAIQSIIRELESDVLRMSVKGASPEIRELFYRNMSQRAAESLREDLELMGPVRRKDVEAAQKRLFAVIRHLDETGEISLRARDDDMVE